MGKGLIIFITGMFIIMGIYQIGSQQRHVASEQDSADYVYRTAATHNASSAAEMTAQKILLNPNWGNSGQDFTTDFPEGPAVVKVNREGAIYRLISTAEANGIEATVEVLYLWQSEAFIPEIHGAMGIFSKNLSFNVAGNAFAIDGNDYKTDGTIKSDSTPTNGIAVDDPANKTLIENELNKQQKDNITGVDETPSIGVVDADISALEASIEFLSNNADEVYTTDHTASGEGSLGTPSNPKVIVVEGGTLSLSNATGAGVIIVKKGGELDIRGNLDHYEGLIFVQGAARLVRGNITVYGAMVFGGEDPELEIDIDLRGNVEIRYSSDAIDMLNETLGARFSGTLVLQGHYR